MVRYAAEALRQFVYNGLDAESVATADPAVVAGGKGSILPLGGMDAGHKGSVLARMVEALTSGPAGIGRSGTPDPRGTSVMVQVINPAAFGGAGAFAAETQAVAESSRASKPIDRARPVRLPGDAALARKARQLAEGVQLHEGIAPSLQILADRLHVEMATPLHD